MRHRCPIPQSPAHRAVYPVILQPGAPRVRSERRFCVITGHPRPMAASTSSAPSSASPRPVGRKASVVQQPRSRYLDFLGGQPPRLRNYGQKLGLDYLDDERLTKTPLLAMARFLIAAGCTHDEVSNAPSHFAMATLAEQRDIDLEPLLHQTEWQQSTTQQFLKRGTAAWRNKTTSSDDGVSLPVGGHPAPPRRASSPARQPPAARSVPTSRSASPRGVASTRPRASSSSWTPPRSSPGSRMPSPHQSRFSACAPAAEPVAEEPIIGEDQAGGSGSRAESRAEKRAKALLARAARADLEELLVRKLVDGSPLQLAELAALDAAAQEDGVMCASVSPRTSPDVYRMRGGAAGT